MANRQDRLNTCALSIDSDAVDRMWRSPNGPDLWHRCRCAFPDHPLAYANAFGAALAVAEGAELWTGDLELLVDGATWRRRDLHTPS